MNFLKSYSSVLRSVKSGFTVGICGFHESVLPQIASVESDILTFLTTLITETITGMEVLSSIQKLLKALPAVKIEHQNYSKKYRYLNVIFLPCGVAFFSVSVVECFGTPKLFRRLQRATIIHVTRFGACDISVPSLEDILVPSIPARSAEVRVRKGYFYQKEHTPWKKSFRPLENGCSEILLRW